jgi:hypothetical protein
VKVTSNKSALSAGTVSQTAWATCGWASSCNSMLRAQVLGCQSARDLQSKARRFGSDKEFTDKVVQRSSMHVREFLWLAQHLGCLLQHPQGLPLTAPHSFTQNNPWKGLIWTTPVTNIYKRIYTTNKPVHADYARHSVSTLPQYQSSEHCTVMCTYVSSCINCFQTSNGEQYSLMIHLANGTNLYHQSAWCVICIRILQCWVWNQ